MDRLLPRLITCLVMLCLASDALATGWPPFARSDSLTVTRGGTSDRLDSGNASVLDNDFDLEGDDLTAILVREPDHGSLEFREDGTFIYVHDGSDSDEDSFRYRAFDGTGYSRRTTVSISIEEVPNSPPRVVEPVDDQEAAEGAIFELALADNFVDPDPDDVLVFSAKGLPKSGSLAIDPISGVLSGMPKKGDARSRPYEVEIRATDRFGAYAILRFDLTIREDNRADVSLDVQVLTNPIGVGETSRWELVVQNNGPGDLELGVLTADWATAGPALSLTAPGDCSLSGNNTSSPTMSCNIVGLAAGTAVTYSVQGIQDDAGDNSILGVLAADDRRPDNNTDLASAQIVAEFSEGPTQVINFAGADIDAGDLDGDGQIDVAAAGAETIVYFNNGNRALATPGTSLGSATGANAITLLDWNGDGHLDIAAGGLPNRTAEIFVNDGSGGFASTARLQANVGVVTEVIGADFDLNGVSELVIAGSAGIVIAQSGDADDAVLSSLSDTGGLDVEIADIDQNGSPDIASIRPTDRTVELYFNNGSGTSFSQQTLQSGSVRALSITDINSDGSPDLLLGLDGDDLQVPQHQVFYQQGNGQFSAGQSFGASPVSGLLAGDINDDGWTDVAAINQAGVHQVYLGSSVGGLSLAPEQLVSSGMTRGVLVDFNSDESLDLVLIGFDGAGLEIHANNGIGQLGLGDRIAPDLQLLGEPTITLAAGEPYVEPGVTAIDDIDGDISDQVVITGTVNTTSVGTQTLTYSISDRAGNTSSAVRTIKIGVNEGTGGSGGGAISPLLLVLCLLLAVRHRFYSAIRN
ncbi:MAG: DUF5011 domain-containing protein [Woeseiaceae bacterium]|nr:DUF5011 domain-containing protein [Woeseiaceae bacterium]NIP20285.1 DUF5011 domain-containing protein [Woeseiaceae bacterium]NIS89158.1 DUF5011 domain-containing protein [Woeseiaceae bacterium]